ncbi:MAG: ribonuclease Y [Thermoplasmata archaeon]|nr:ribonuclease Y [Thermoplasmata archaeon]
MKEAETEKKQRRLEIKDELFKSKADFEKQTRRTREEVRALEKRIQQREESLDRKVDILDKKEEDISRREKDLSARQSDMDKRENKLKRSIEESNRQLQRISGMSRAEAREIYLSRMEDELKHEAAAMIHRVESEAREKAEKEARNIIALAAQRCASDYISESTISTVALPNDEMKGRIIGREGRNIRALEAATGIDIIIDDTPEAVVLSGFDAVRKEIARISLERLMLDGRIHPARIEEVVEKVKSEVDKTIKETGERAAFDTGIHNLHPEIIKLLGRLKFRTSYGQNVLQHSIEVADLVGVMAAELGLDVKLAKRIGFLHDIGKATTHEVEGAHAQIGADLARRYREKPIVVNGIAAHHMETDAQSVFAVLVQAGDSLSAARPGARAETLAIYMKRLEKLEEIANSFNGIEKAYAIQAGREIRVIVEPSKVNDDETVLLARNLSRKIEEDMEYPGQVKVTIIRETRAVEYAR